MLVPPEVGDPASKAALPVKLEMTGAIYVEAVADSPVVCPPTVTFHFKSIPTPGTVWHWI
jgi:hypothetical protein